MDRDNLVNNGELYKVPLYNLTTAQLSTSAEDAQYVGGLSPPMGIDQAAM